jgi:pimeloyl-ACP methyl ester carboxylesterase
LIVIWGWSSIDDYASGALAGPLEGSDRPAVHDRVGDVRRRDDRRLPALGRGPGVVLVHGGMQAAQNFTKLATVLADTFTVYVPDRRGRGLSGPFGDRYGLIASATTWASSSPRRVRATCSVLARVR